MSGKTHTYTCAVTWTGNTGQGTAGYKAYARAYVISAAGKPDIPGSSDPAFRGDATRYNPEDMLVASLSTCHMLWYLHLASDAGIVVTAYRDEPLGMLVEDALRGGWFTRVLLRPQVTIAPGSDAAVAHALHQAAHGKCYVANSVNFPVACEPQIITGA